MTSVRIEPLSRENYDSWRLQAEAILTKNELWGYTNGTIKRPAEPAEAAEWVSKDAKARAELILVVSPSELRHVRGCETSCEIWQKLQTIHASKGPARKASLLKQLTLYKMGDDEDIQDHLAQFFDAKDKLNDMGVDIHKDLTSILLLYSLPASFENFRCAIESRDEFPDPDILKIKIVEESNARNTEDENVSLVKNKSVKPVTYFKYKCFKCHRFGHRASECKKSQEQELIKYTVETENISKCDIDSSFITFSCVSDECHNVSCGGGNWIVDSGCTSHLCNDKSLFGNFMEIPKAKICCAVYMRGRVCQPSFKYERGYLFEQFASRNQVR